MKTFKSLRWAALAGFGVVVLGAGLAGAETGEGEEGRERGPCCRGSRGSSSMIEDLNLNEEQTAYFEEVQAFRKQRREARRGEGRGGMFEGLEDGDLDADTIHSTIDEQFEEARAQAHAAADARLVFLGSLDDEQRQVLSEKLEQRSPRGQRVRGDCEGDKCQRSGDRCKRRGRCSRGDRGETEIE